MQADNVLRAGRSAEGHQPRPAQHHPADVAIAAIVRILETEHALESEPSVFPAMQAHASGVHRLVEPLHARRAAGVATKGFRALRSGAPRAPVREGKR